MGFTVVLKKELRDMFTSKRFIVLVVVFLVFYIAGFFYLASIGLPQIRNPIPFFLSSYGRVLSLMASLLGVAFGYDAIAGERERGTLRIVLAQPIYRDSLALGKLAAFLVLTTTSIYASTFISLGVFVAGFGGAVTDQDIIRVSLVALAAVLLSLVYYSVSLLFSVFSKKASHSAMLSLAVWILLVAVLPLIATMVAVSVAGPPPRGLRGVPQKQRAAIIKEWSRRFNQARSTVMKISPNTFFEMIVFTIVREAASQSGKTIPLYEALSSIAPSYAILAIVPLVLLPVGFIIFVRQEEK